MYRFKKIMIALDFSAMDKILIRYSGFLLQRMETNKVYFINIQRKLEIPDIIKKNFPELNKPIDEKLCKDMQVEVEKGLKNYKDYDIEYQVKEGLPFEEMLQWTGLKNIDLLILGRKQGLKGSGIVSHRLASKARCSVLMIPEKAKRKRREIYVPTDFSKNSKMALEVAISLGKHDENATIYCHHVYHLPSGYYITGKTEEQFSLVMKEHATKKYNELINDLNIKGVHISPIFNLDLCHSVATIINDKIHKLKAGLIVMGARGHTNTTAFLLGSVTENIIRYNNNVLVLIIKEKDRTFNFLNLIKTI